MIVENYVDMQNICSFISKTMDTSQTTEKCSNPGAKIPTPMNLSASSVTLADALIEIKRLCVNGRRLQMKTNLQVTGAYATQVLFLMEVPGQSSRPVVLKGTVMKTMRMRDFLSKMMMTL